MGGLSGGTFACSPGDSDGVAGVRDCVPLHWLVPPHSSTLGSTSVVNSVSIVVSFPSAVGGDGHPRGQCFTVVNVLMSSHVAFLSSVWSQHSSADVVTELFQGFRASPTRQYELCWKRFQMFLRWQPVSVSRAMVI